MTLSPKRANTRLNKPPASASRPRRAARSRLGLESLEDRVVPSLASPNNHWIATVIGAPGIESIRVTENGSGRLVYQSGAVRDIMAGTMTWSPNSLELAWVEQYAVNNFSYNWAGVLPSPTGVPSFSTPPSAPVFSADSRLLTFNLPGNPPSVSFSVPTTPPGVRITGLPGTVTAGSPFNLTVTATVNDFIGLPYVGTLTLSSSDGQTVLGQSTLTMTSANRGSAPATIQLNKAGALAIRGTESNGTWGNSPLFTVSPAGVSSFDLSAPGTAIVGAPFNVTLTAKDRFGNVATSYFGTVALSCSNGSGVSPATVRFSNGTATAAVTLTTAGAVRLQALDGFVSGTSGGITVNQAATTTTLAASAHPSVFGQPVTYTATVRAVAPSSAIPTGHVTFVVAGGAPVTVPLNALGQASLTLPSLAVGKHTINASYFANPSFGNSTATATHTVNLALPTTVPGAMAGDNYSASVKASGGSGSCTYTVASGALPAGLSISRAGVLSGVATVAGKYTFTVKATDDSLAGVSGSQAYSLVVSPAAIRSLGVSAPATAKAGVEFWVTITAKDRFGNGLAAPVTLTSSDGQAVTWTPKTVNPGNIFGHAFLYKAAKVKLTAKVGAVSGTGIDVTVYPAAISSFVVGVPATAKVGAAFTITVTAKDKYGNTINGFGAPLALTRSDGKPVTVVGGAWGPNGVATMTIKLNAPGTVTLTATYGVIKGTSVPLTVTL